MARQAVLPEWATYKIDKAGNRLPKTEPPPQGSYKVSDGMGRTDYSDPRDFFASTQAQQLSVWEALGPVRLRYLQITDIQLQFRQLRFLPLGYNATYDEIKRRLVGWIFSQHGPGQNENSGPIEPVCRFYEASKEIPGYGTIGTKKAPSLIKKNPLDLVFFIDGVLVVKPHELLEKLERWYGLIEDYRFSPTWPKQQRNKLDLVVQNPECTPCQSCRTYNIFCYGHREHVDRKCKPCELIQVTCSKEESPKGNPISAISSNSPSSANSRPPRQSSNAARQAAQRQQRRVQPQRPVRPKYFHGLVKQSGRRQQLPSSLSNNAVQSPGPVRSHPHIQNITRLQAPIQSNAGLSQGQTDTSRTLPQQVSRNQPLHNYGQYWRQQ